MGNSLALEVLWEINRARSMGSVHVERTLRQTLVDRDSVSVDVSLMRCSTSQPGPIEMVGTSIS